MSAGKTTFEVDAGTTYRGEFDVSLRYNDGTEEPYDFTDAHVWATVRDSQRLVMRRYELEILEYNRVRIELSPDETNQYVPHRRYYVVVDIHWPSGDVERVLEGVMRVRPRGGGVGRNG